MHYGIGASLLSGAMALCRDSCRYAAFAAGDDFDRNSLPIMSARRLRSRSSTPAIVVSPTATITSPMRIPAFAAGLEGSTEATRTACDRRRPAITPQRFGSMAHKHKILDRPDGTAHPW